MLKKVAITVVVASFSVLAAYASNNAADQASNSPYEPGNSWTNGQNGGFGFGSWILTTTSGDTGQNGFFMGTSTGNAGGSLGIDTSGVSWGMYANSGQTANAVRPFTGGSLGIGQEFDFKFDNGFLNSGSSEGFGLQTTGGTNRLEFFFAGGNSDYTLSDLSSFNHDTGIAFTGNGLSFAFTLTSVNTYSLAVTPNGGSTSTFTGTLEGVAGTGIDQIRFFDFNGGNGQGSNGDFFANSLEVVPEPSTIAAGVLAVAGAFLLRRRRVKTA